MQVSPCGVHCDECLFFEKECNGCRHIEGKVFWAVEHLPEKICPMFDCAVNEKHFPGCGSCNELPCHWYYEMKDPSMTDEEHKISIETRVKILKGLA
ncbi:MAG: DUF3795 domain-containing protein [Lentimicrobiaceae bacterium]|nr:DUF3795 domain-containing protein [Lentimicrobiaceae bacterium]